MNLIILCYLITLSVFDIRRREVPMVFLTGGTITAFCLAGYGILFNGQDWWIYAAGLLPGFIFLGFSVMTGKIGFGDGWTLMVIGVLVGCRQCIVLLLMSLLLVSIAAMVLMALRKVRRDTEMPYIPFLALSAFINLTLARAG